ncbi:hypothetical protein E2C01_022821 [Portunus trituberculatus]|uniref:Uncharacterized protein n=1 Tax=Portunus trituberculatus TaxID=210409 RepID=A0A5B7E6E0_PORTR|nr:hypothetical protein [Portunus trituberculatus]
MEHAEANGGGGEAEPGERKPDQLKLIMSMLASMRAEQSEKARQQSEQARQHAFYSYVQLHHLQSLAWPARRRVNEGSCDQVKVVDYL